MRGDFGKPLLPTSSEDIKKTRTDQGQRNPYISYIFDSVEKIDYLFGKITTKCLLVKLMSLIR